MDAVEIFPLGNVGYRRVSADGVKHVGIELTDQATGGCTIIWFEERLFIGFAEHLSMIGDEILREYPAPRI